MNSERLSLTRIFAVLVVVCAVGAGLIAFKLPRRVDAAQSAAGPSGYHLLKTIKLGGEGFWDYLAFDSPTRRLFISRGNKVVAALACRNQILIEAELENGRQSFAKLQAYFASK